MEVQFFLSFFIRLDHYSDLGDLVSIWIRQVYVRIEDDKLAFAWIEFYRGPAWSDDGSGVLIFVECKLSSSVAHQKILVTIAIDIDHRRRGSAVLDVDVGKRVRGVID